MSPAAEEEVSVGIGELVVTDEPNTTLIVHGLGSCVAVVAYSRTPLVGGMLHIMLPLAPEGDGAMPTRYADSGIEALWAAFRKRGAAPRNAVVRLVGGAAVLRMAGGAKSLRVGERNIDAAESTLRRLGIPVRARDVGGDRGRTVEFAVGTGLVRVRTLGEAYRTI